MHKAVVRVFFVFVFLVFEDRVSLCVSVSVLEIRLAGITDMCATTRRESSEQSFVEWGPSSS